ncbi:putative f-box domain protein [Teratosphaeria destructans]|uniref:F-box domain protein n=1 Tax=Teratosphaeria destructans TaxID=418781 RepID=A0A9W7W340_9PEZI|nr:putative f-box domain protein [Teratosphaeria destructans]
MAAATEDGLRPELSQLKQQQSDITKLLARLVDAQEQSNGLQKQHNELLVRLVERNDNNTSTEAGETSNRSLLDAQKRTNELLVKLVEHQDDQALDKITSRPPLDAGTRLTGTFELLEKILLHLDCEQIFWLQGVSHQFRTTIKNSLALQRALFLAPVPFDDSKSQDVVLNPFFQKDSVRRRLPIYFDHVSRRLAYIDRPYRTRLSVSSISHYGRDPRITLHFRSAGGNNTLDRFNTAAPVITAGSWRQMYLSQPPVGVDIEGLFSRRLAKSLSIDCILDAMTDP